MNGYRDMKNRAKCSPVGTMWSFSVGSRITALSRLGMAYYKQIK